MNSSQDRLQVITRKLADYFVLHTLCIQKAQTLEGDRNAMFRKLEEAQKDWQSDASNPHVMPPREDEEKRAAFFSKCDEICNLRKTASQDCSGISFACGAVVFVLEEQDLAENERDEVMKNSSAIAHHEFIERHSQPVVYADPTGAIMTTSNLSKLFSSTEEDASDSLGPHVINQVYHVHHPEKNQVTTCTVLDFGSSYLRGEWFEVEYDDASTCQITRNEMEEILRRSQR